MENFNSHFLSYFRRTEKMIVAMVMFYSFTAVSQPIISSFSPQSGSIGTSVIIRGANFSTIAANNVVYFGAAKTTVLNATDSTIVVNVPQGATFQPVSVTTNKLTAYSAQPFVVTNAGGGPITSNSFHYRNSFRVGLNPFYIAMADFDMDGKNDLMTVNSGYSNLSLLRNTSIGGTLSFAPQVVLSTGLFPVAGGVADFDGDGKLDIAVSNHNSNNIGVYRNKSTIGNFAFTLPKNFNVGSSPERIAIADLNADGKPDVAVVNAISNNVSILNNISVDTNIAFGASGQYITGQNPHCVALCDFDVDGKPDMVVGNGVDATITLYLNVSTGSTIAFSFPQTYATGMYVYGGGPYNISTGDLDGDGKQEIVTTNNNRDTTTIFKNNSVPGFISFAPPVAMKGGDGPFGLALHDLDGDGKLDIAITNDLNNTISVYNNQSSVGNISFSNKIDIPTGSGPRYIVIGDLNLDGQPDIATAGYNNDSATVLLNKSFYNTLQFEAFVDKNGNGTKESSESFFPNANASISKTGGGTLYAYSASGAFNMDVDTGSYSTSVISSNLYYTPVPASYTTSHTTYFNKDTFSIAMQPLPGIKDVSTAIIPLSLLRSGNNVKFKILVTNTGTEPVSGSFQLIKESNLMYQSASITPVSMSSDTLHWDYANLQPLDTTGVIVTFYLQAALGDTLNLSASASVVPGESYIQDNFAYLSQVVISSYDPNDKTENHGGSITKSKVDNGEYLQYTIRFQNTGNDTAFNVYVRDTLDTKLDWSSFRMLDASNNYQLTINENNKCVWKLNNINLPDSNINEPLSHGYLTYVVKVKSTIQVGDIITNKAAIYFDYNLPVNTNTEKTTVVADVFPLRLLSFTANLTPAPLQGERGKAALLQWTSANEINVDRFEVERSPSGRDFGRIGKVKAGLTSYSFIDNLPLTTHNFYRLKIIDKDGQFTYSPIRLLTTYNSPLTITIYPNPAKDNLQVQIDLTPTPLQRRGAMQLLVLSLDGKLLLSNNVTTSEGSILRSINISALPKGNYFLKVISLNPPTADREAEEQVVKFEKL